MLASSLAAPMAFGLAFDGVHFLGVFLPVVVASAIAVLAAIAVVFVSRPWMAIVGAVVAGLVLALGASDPTPGAMTRPSLGIQMSWGHAARLAGLVGLVAGIVEFRLARGRPAGPLARAVPVAGVLALGLALGVGATTLAATHDRGFMASGDDVELQPDATVRVIESGDAFRVSGSASPGAIVRMVVENKDTGPHTVTSNAKSIFDVETLAGTTTTIWTRAPDQVGEWSFYCKYHPGMTGVVRVA